MNPQTAHEYRKKHERRTHTCKQRQKNFQQPGVLASSMADGHALYSYTSKINPEGKLRPLTKDHEQDNMLRLAIEAIKRAVGIRTQERAVARRAGK